MLSRQSAASVHSPGGSRQRRLGVQMTWRRRCRRREWKFLPLEEEQEPLKVSSAEVSFPPGIAPGPPGLHSPDAGWHSRSQHQGGQRQRKHRGSREPRAPQGPSPAALGKTRQRSLPGQTQGWGRGWAPSQGLEQGTTLSIKELVPFLSPPPSSSSPVFFPSRLRRLLSLIRQCLEGIHNPLA